MKKLKKRISVFMTVIMTASFLSIHSFAEQPDDKETVINALVDQRRSAALSIEVDGGQGLDTSEFEAQIEEIDEQLACMGVETLTSQEVLEQFNDNDEGVAAYAALPESENVFWFTYRNNITYDGVAYEVQTLLAMVKDGESSNLRETGAVVLQNKNKWEASALNVWKLTAKNGLYYYLNSNRYTQIAKNIYEYGKAFISGLSEKTVIKNVKAVYTYNVFTTASFKCVKKKGDPDSKQMMTYISTSCEVALSGNFPTFYYDGNGVNHPDIITFKEKIIARPIGYSSDYNAVKAFTSIYEPTRAYVDGLDIYGLEGRKLITVCKMRPQFPAHII